MGEKTRNGETAALQGTAELTDQELDRVAGGVAAGHSPMELGGGFFEAPQRTARSLGDRHDFDKAHVDPQNPVLKGPGIG